MCKTVKKTVLVWSGIVFFLISTAVGVTLWAQSQHETIEDKCEDKCQSKVDIHAKHTAEVYAKREDVAEIKTDVKYIRRAVIRLERKLEAE